MRDLPLLSLISNWLQPGEHGATSYETVSTVFPLSWKPLKRLASVFANNTRLKPGANEKRAAWIGALLTLHLGLSYPTVFGKLALLSPSVWWDDRWIIRQVNAHDEGAPSLRVWLDVGTGETRMLKGAQLLYRTLLRKGWKRGVNLEYLEAEGALHDERAWGQRTGLFLQFLFPAAHERRRPR